MHQILPPKWFLKFCGIHSRDCRYRLTDLWKQSYSEGCFVGSSILTILLTKPLSVSILCTIKSKKSKSFLYVENLPLSWYKFDFMALTDRHMVVSQTEDQPGLIWMHQNLILFMLCYVVFVLLLHKTFTNTRKHILNVFSVFLRYMCGFPFEIWNRFVKDFWDFSEFQETYIVFCYLNNYCRLGRTWGLFEALLFCEG